jgi:zinc protease
MNKILILFVFVSLNSVAAPEIQHWQTSKGVDVYFVETHELPMIDLQLVFDAGSVRDPADKRGLSLIVNSLLEQAADGLTADQISFEFERLGAQFSTDAGYDSASISLRSLADTEKLGPALENLQRVISSPDFPAQALERERNITLVGIQRKQQSPRSISQEKFYEAIFQGHPYAYPNEGTADSLKTITRQDLLNFHNRYYTANNVMISLVGDIRRSRAEAIAETVTKNLKNGPAAGAYPPVKQLATAGTIKQFHPSTQVHILIGQPGMKYADADYFPLYVGNHILGGGGLVSRLFEEIREKRGLSYGASSYFSPRRELGPFLANISTREDQADEALSVLRQTIAGFVENGPTELELKAAKKNITGGFPLRIDSNRKISGYVSVIGFYGLPLDYLDRFTGEIEAVTVADIKRAFSRRIKVENFVTVLVGPVAVENQNK